MKSSYCTMLHLFIIFVLGYGEYTPSISAGVAGVCLVLVYEQLFQLRFKPENIEPGSTAAERNIYQNVTKYFVYTNYV